MRNALKEHLYNYGLVWLLFGLPIALNVACWLVTGKMLPQVFPWNM